MPPFYCRFIHIDICPKLWMINRQCFLFMVLISYITVKI